MEDVNWTRVHLWWLKASFVALFTRHMWRCVEMYYMLWKNKSKLRYKRLTHINNKGFQILAKKSLIPFSRGRMLNPCNHCFFNKQHNLSFAISSQKKSNPWISHSDVCGPFEVESLGGNRYFVTFIDDASRKMWGMRWTQKIKCFNHFNNFMLWLIREAEKQLKCLCTNGWE